MSIFKTIKVQVVSAFKRSFNAANYERLYTASQLDVKWNDHGSFQRSRREMAQYKASTLNSRHFVSDLWYV